VAAEGFAVETKDTKWGDLRSSYRIASTVEAALIGGTSAVITGGGTQGFVNGAASGAMSRLFNFEGEHEDEEKGLQQGGGSMSMGAVMGAAGIAAVSDSPVPGPGDVVAAGIIIVGGSIVLYNALTTDGSAASTTTSSETNQCTSGCTLLDGTQIPVGTVSFRLDTVPPSKPHFPFEGSHVHLFRANQNPKNCQCFWKEFNVVAPPPPADAIPIQPFLN
jgi:hypothetical protein